MLLQRRTLCSRNHVNHQKHSSIAWLSQIGVNEKGMMEVQARSRVMVTIQYS